jgi:hypothetical protein
VLEILYRKRKNKLVKVYSMATNVNLFTNDNLNYYTRVRVCIGWQNI